MVIRSLNGLWTVEIPDTCIEANVNVPGNLREYSGFENHSGTAVFRRMFTLSDTDIQKHTELRFGGIMKNAEVIVNGTSVGKHKGGQAPFRFDISELIKAGENCLTVITDDKDDSELSNAPLFDIIPIPVRGIYENVTLEFSENAFVRSVYAPLDLESRQINLSLEVISSYTEECSAELDIMIMQGETALKNKTEITLCEGRNEVLVKIPLGSLRLWTPEEPTLCHTKTKLSANGKTDVSSHTTGLKHLEARGTDFYLNGVPYYMLGYGDDFVYPNGVPSATGREFYHYGLKRAKEYGFNYARHHSHFPFEAFLDAADELGLLIQPELALANIPREQFNDENKLPFLREWEELIRAYRHHPCIAMWSGGNEMEWGYPFDKELYDLAKRLDPYRPVSSTDGNFMACDVTEAQDWASICPAEYTDYLPWRELSDMFTRDNSGKPQIAHEMGNYTTLPDISLPDKYPKTKIPFTNSEKLRKTAEEKGLSELYAEAFEASRSLQKLCHKLNIEKARLSPFFCGYHVWTITDFHGTTQGLLDGFYGDKSFTAEEFSEFNRQSVLLFDTERVVFSSEEETELVFKLSRYGSTEKVTGKLTVELDSKSEECDVELSEKGIITLTAWKVRLPRVSREKEFLLSAGLRLSSGETLTNSWRIFVCPEVEIGTEREIYLNYISKYVFKNDTVPVRHFTIPQPIGKKQLIVTGFLYGGMLEAVENGANMLFLADENSFKNTVTRNSFKTPWWDNGEIWYLNHTNNKQVCGIVDPELKNGLLPYCGGWQLDLFGAVEQAPAIDTDAFGYGIKPLIYGVDLELRRHAYLFEFRLGEGRVTVCTLNHGMRDMEDPAVRYLIRSLVNRAMSDKIHTDNCLSAKEFTEMFK